MVDQVGMVDLRISAPVDLKQELQRRAGPQDCARYCRGLLRDQLAAQGRSRGVRMPAVLPNSKAPLPLPTVPVDGGGPVAPPSTPAAELGDGEDDVEELRIRVPRRMKREIKRKAATAEITISIFCVRLLRAGLDEQTRGRPRGRSRLPAPAPGS